jgi:hypothetical protein
MIRIVSSSRSVNDHHDDSTIDGSDGDKAVFVVGMDFIKDLQIVGARLEQLSCLFEGKAVFGLIGDVFLRVPVEAHRTILGQWRSQSMA